MRTLRIGMAGFGTVGKSVYELITRRADEIARRTGVRLALACVTSRHPERVRALVSDSVQVLPDSLSVARADVDIALELMGGTGDAGVFVREALSRGLPVVTANKALLALQGTELFALAREKRLAIAWEAAVGGAVPMVRVVRESLSGDEIQSVEGLLNGTCGYVLEQMRSQGRSFSEALSEAQRLGYAEADPTLDVGGGDAAHKTALLARIAFGMAPVFSGIPVEGIDRLEPLDFACAQAWGGEIRLAGRARRVPQGLAVRVGPVFAPREHPFAAVRSVTNALLARGRAAGPILLTGRGAGGDATASAVVSDLIAVGTGFGEAGGWIPPAVQGELAPEIVPADETFCPEGRLLCPEAGVQSEAVRGALERAGVEVFGNRSVEGRVCLRTGPVTGAVLDALGLPGMRRLRVLDAEGSR